MNFEQYFSISTDPYYFAALAVDFILLFAMLVLVRKLFGRSVGGVDTTAELAENDNHAFGISLGGATVALAIVFAGVASGDVATSLAVEAAFILGYGVLGIAMLMCTRWIFDKIVFPGIDLKQMILQGNIAAGILDGGNMVATAAVIYGVFSWISGNWLTGVGLVIGMFVVTQMLLVLVSRYRTIVFAKRNQGRVFAKAIEDGNAALALRFAGFQIGAALAISSAGKLVNFQEDGQIMLSIAAWVVSALVLLAAIILLTALTEKVVLYGVPVAREVDAQSNYGVAAVEAGAYIGLGLIIVTLLG